MAYTPIPDAHSPAPNPYQGNAQFNVNAQGFVDSLQPVIDGMNLAGSQIDQMRDEVSDFSAAAESASESSLSSANISAATANNKGNWSILPTTAAEPPYSVNYGGSVYILQRSLTNVRSVTPGTDPDTWFNYSQSATGLTVVTSPTDTTVNRVVNTQWDFYRAVFSQNPVDKRETSASVDLVNNNNFPVASKCMADYRNGTMPGFGTWVISTLRISGSWNAQFAMRIVSDTVGYFFRVGGSNDFTGIPWIPLHGGGTGDTTSAMQGFVDLGEMGASGGVNATIDLSAGRYFFINMNNANTSGGFTFNLINEPESGAVDCVLFVVRPARKGAWTLPSNVKWAAGFVPSMSATTNHVVAIHLFKTPNWVNYVATVNTMENSP